MIQITRKSNSNSSPPLRIAMVMAAGLGTRMAELTREIPKPLLPLNGKRIIDIILHKLSASGIERVVINLHYLPEQIRQYAGDGSRYNLEIFYSHEPEILGSGGGIANAEKFFKQETILTVNADVLCAVDIRRFYEWFLSRNVIAAMCLFSSRQIEEYSLVEYDRDQRMTRILPRHSPLPSAALTGIFTGVQLLTFRARKYLKPVNQSIIGELYLKALQNGQTIAVYPYVNQWYDLGSKELYESAVKKIMSGEIDLSPFIK